VSARAIVVRQFGSADVFRLEDVAIRQPGPAELLVRVHAAGVNPVEAYMATGTYARKPTLPYTPGSDGAGEIEATGADVKDLGPGDRVYIAGDNSSAAGAGTYATHAVSTRTQVHRLPDHVSYAQGAALGVPYATAYRALFVRGAARPGETVLVHGATGGVGIATVQFALAHGLTVVGTGGSDAGLRLLHAQGVHAVLNHREPNYLEVAMRATGGRGFDIVIEMAAHINLDKDLGVLARGGRVVVVGNRGRVEIDARQTMGRDAAILGMTLFNASPAELASIHAAIRAGLATRVLKPIVGREMPLADASKALETIMQPGALGKIVLIP
jgi:NADPH2:quinone reductase